MNVANETDERKLKNIHHSDISALWTETEMDSICIHECEIKYILRYPPIHLCCREEIKILHYKLHYCIYSNPTQNIQQKCNLFNCDIFCVIIYVALPELCDTWYSLISLTIQFAGLACMYTQCRSHILRSDMCKLRPDTLKGLKSTALCYMTSSQTNVPSFDVCQEKGLKIFSTVSY